MGQEGLEALTVAQLRERAAELGVSGRSSMNKAELVEAVADAEALASEWSPPYDREREAGGQSREAEGQSRDTGGDGEKPAAKITAPSIGPNTVIEKRPPEERLDHDKISRTDAMGLDKRREVVGHAYSAPLSKQIALYALFLVVVGALAFGGKLLVDELDAPPAEYPAKAPWSDPGAEQIPPQPLQ